MKQNILKKLEHLPDDRIGDGIYVAYEWAANENGRRLSRIYIGSKTVGPMLQYEPYDNDLYGDAVNVEVAGIDTTIEHGAYYNGVERVYFLGGAWTNLYSRGNFGKSYAYGGTRSGHTKNLHPRLKVSPIADKSKELLVIDEDNIIDLPKGIKGNVTVTDMDCSGSWSIYYASAREAIANRLKMSEIREATLPAQTKDHLLKNETQEVLDCLNDVIEAYEL